jgi:hypothetical protein
MADYRVISNGPDTFMVEITFPSGHLQLIAGFLTEVAAWERMVTRQATKANAEPRT